jgi:hypothetical protein
VPKEPFDVDEEPPGGRAAERLREFERARGISPDETDQLDAPDDDDSAGVIPESQATESADDTSEDD